jgi:chromosome segregation ATPase
MGLKLRSSDLEEALDLIDETLNSLLECISGLREQIEKHQRILLALMDHSDDLERRLRQVEEKFREAP